MAVSEERLKSFEEHFKKGQKDSSAHNYAWISYTHAHMKCMDFMDACLCQTHACYAYACASLAHVRMRFLHAHA